MPSSAVPASVDVVVIGDGVIGLSTTLELGRAGLRCLLVGRREPGAASGAAAGLLAPSVGTLPLAARPFFFESLERFPAFLESVRSFDPELGIVRGLIDLSSDAALGDGSRMGTPITQREVQALEPLLAAPRGGRLHPRDGAIDNLRLVAALRRAVEAATPFVAFTDSAIAIERQATGVAVRLGSGARVAASTVVVAAGAWSPQIAGLPRALPVRPLKGQMLAIAFSGVARPVMGDEVYLVPRGNEIAIGATAEHAGFDIGTRPAAIEAMRREACGICPALAGAPVVRTWAGIRPATPDMLPIIGRDPDDPRLIYACGHSKNGILLAPATGAAVAALASGRPVTANLDPFAISRFGAGGGAESIT